MENKTRRRRRRRSEEEEGARGRRSRRGVASGGRDGEGYEKREHDVVIMEAQRFNNVTMNERA